MTDPRDIDADACAPIGVVGLGYAGWALAGNLRRAGRAVVGWDADGGVLEGRAAQARELGMQLTAEPSGLAECQAVFLCLPTPIDADRQPDLSAIVDACGAIRGSLRRGAGVVLCSTTWPGTTREVVAREVEAEQRGLWLAYSPEREDPGRTDPPSHAVPRLVGGLDDASRDAALALLEGAYDQLVPVESAEVAESAKLFENVFRAVNIALVNELKQVLTGLDIDVWQVLEAASTKPFGFLPFTPGPGMGGHCIPVDPFYLSWIAKRSGSTARFVELAGELNRALPRSVVERTAAALAERDRPLNGATVLVLGVAYKPDVADLRCSPGVAVLAELHRRGAVCAYHDPYVPRLAGAEDSLAGEPLHPDVTALASTPLDQAVLEAADAVLLITAHTELDLDRVARHARLAVDTRNALASRLAGDPRYLKA